MFYLSTYILIWRGFCIHVLDDEEENYRLPTTSSRRHQSLSGDGSSKDHTSKVYGGLQTKRGLKSTGRGRMIKGGQAVKGKVKEIVGGLKFSQMIL